MGMNISNCSENLTDDPFYTRSMQIYFADVLILTKEVNLGSLQKRGKLFRMSIDWIVNIDERYRDRVFIFKG